MGLDIIELIMRVEEEFNIEIPDEDVEQLATVGSMADYIAQKMASTEEEQLQIWLRLCVVIEDQCAIAPHKITRASRLVEDLNLG